MSKMAKHSWILICFACFIMVSMVIADRNQVTSTSGSDFTFNICLHCCGPPPCCNDCGLSKGLLSLLRPVVGSEVEGKQVVPAKRYLDDKFPDLGQDLCLDCCGAHPCCHDCGLGHFNSKLCATCCGPPPCCHYCGLGKDLLSLLKPVVQHPKDCSDLKYKHNKSGVYRIYPNNVKSFKVYCDMDTDGGSWTVIQRRINGKTDFFRGWKDYEDGFGSLDKEFWLGNSKISRLTMQKNYELRIDLEDFNGNKAYAKYSTFYVRGAATKYKLHVDGYSGTAVDGMVSHNGQAFTTKDSDNDSWEKNCAARYKGGWWYNKCYGVNINALYLGNKSSDESMNWYPWKQYQSMKTVSMMIRRKSTN